MAKANEKNMVGLTESCRLRARNFILAARQMESAAIAFEEKDWDEGLNFLDKAKEALDQK
ncbi:hypothetical protein KAR91_84325 [Candidatus Pacearchaeota archaeon]|nr:hypothetical protein [Candidatus Pacearchaeota archaeon]